MYENVYKRMVEAGIAEKEEIEIKQEIKKKKVKKMMVRVDPDEMIIRNKISEKDDQFQSSANEKEKIRFENEKLKQELKKLEYSKNTAYKVKHK